MAQKQVIIVTGASSGIGNIIALTLAQAGYEVYGTSRKPDYNKRLPFQMVELDITDDESVRRCIEYVHSSAGRIDVLVNNVGSLIFGSAEETAIAETIHELERNFLGTVRMSQAVIPIMRKQRNGKIINISSLAGMAALPFNSASSAGKFALEGYSEALRFELLTFGIYVSLVELSGTKGDGQSRSMQPVKDTIELYDGHRQHAYQKMMHDIADSSLSKQQVADTVLKIIIHQQPRLRYAVGMPSRLIPFLKFILPQRLFQQVILSRMGY